MIAQLAESVRDCFKAEMAKRLPAFDAIEPDLQALKVSEVLVFFVYLSIDDDKDSFALEVASSCTGRYPWTEMPGQLRDVPSASSKDVWRFRISKLWGEVKDYRWVLGDEADGGQTVQSRRNKPRLRHDELAMKVGEVGPKVKDAVDKLCRHAVPYFELAAKKHSSNLKIDVTST